jgi:hypothetical protein
MYAAFCHVKITRPEEQSSLNETVPALTRWHHFHDRPCAAAFIRSAAPSADACVVATAAAVETTAETIATISVVVNRRLAVLLPSRSGDRLISCLDGKRA